MVDVTFYLLYNGVMITFTRTDDGYIFNNNTDPLAIGVVEDGNFHLLHKDKIIKFGNAMQAFVHLRSVYEPREASAQTLELFTKPSHPLDNMSKWLNNPVLKDIDNQTFHAYENTTR